MATSWEVGFGSSVYWDLCNVTVFWSRFLTLRVGLWVLLNVTDLLSGNTWRLNHATVLSCSVVHVLLAGKEGNFQEKNGNTQGLPYDINSIMHYGGYST